MNLGSAAKYLDIDYDKFWRIHTKALKIRHINYKYYKKEFELLCGKKEPDFRDLDRARDSILASEAVVMHIDIPGIRYCIGLSALDRQSPLDSKKVSIPTNQPPQANQQTNESLLIERPKASGVEPGMIGVMKDDIFLYVAEKYKSREERNKFYSENGFDLFKIKEAIKHDLPEYMWKCIYELDENNNLIVPKEGVERTSIFKRLKKISPVLSTTFVIAYRMFKVTDVVNKNVEVLSEVIANDLARFFMTVQDQNICLGKTESGIIQLLLKAEMLKNIRELGGDEGENLKGGTNADNYLVKAIKLPQGNIKYISDSSINNLGSLLPFFLLISDRDSIGSKGQNKLCKEKNGETEIIGIDFGKAFESRVGYNINNFHANDSKFKNYSIFYDTQRSDIVRGIFKLARLNGMEINEKNEKVMKSYGLEFFEEIKAIEPNAMTLLFQNYISTIIEMKNEYPGNRYFAALHKENRDCCDKMSELIGKLKSEADKRAKDIVSNAEVFLNHDKNIIDLAENLEKLVAASFGDTTLLSPDGTVLLNHMAIKNDKYVCKIDKSASMYTLTIDCAENVEVEKQLEKFRKDSPLLVGSTNKSINCLIKYTKSGVSFVFAEDKMANVCAAFSESEIMKKFHSNHYKLLQEIKSKAAPVEQEAVSLAKQELPEINELSLSDEVAEKARAAQEAAAREEAAAEIARERLIQEAAKQESLRQEAEKAEAQKQAAAKQEQARQKVVDISTALQEINDGIQELQPCLKRNWVISKLHTFFYHPITSTNLCATLTAFDKSKLLNKTEMNFFVNILKDRLTHIQPDVSQLVVPAETEKEATILKMLITKCSLIQDLSAGDIKLYLASCDQVGEEFEAVEELEPPSLNR